NLIFNHPKSQQNKDLDDKPLGKVPFRKHHKNHDASGLHCHNPRPLVTKSKEIPCKSFAHVPIIGIESAADRRSARSDKNNRTPCYGAVIFYASNSESESKRSQ
ncbi:MAG: hypothetical protein WDA11_13230, partial [Thiohalomonadaceae bacterium]